jgi:sigma-B regulation protein RsbU (phosphoserine phosphatase)
VPRVESPSIKLAQLEPPPQHPAFEDLPGLGELCRNFTNATGWPLRYVSEIKPAVELMWHVPLCPELDASPGFLRIDLGNASSLDDLRRRIPLEAAEKLAESLARQLGQQWQLSLALWEREADLATAVPVVARADEGPKLSARMQSILKSAVQALNCTSAALYLLDDATSELKMRSAYGLPADRLTQPARPLAPALADLEALLGHAVVLDSPAIFSRWKVPEVCQSAICIPVSSPTVPLGTMWLFNDKARDYTDEEVNLCEIIAGRVAAELERSSLLNEQAKTKQENRLVADTTLGVLPAGPMLPPLVSGWDIAGWSSQAATLGGAFHDWVMLPDGRLAVWLGDACDGGLAGSTAAKHDALLDRTFFGEI